MTTDTEKVSMAELARRLENAEAEAARIRQQIAAGPCREFGHDWRSCGGANAGCDLDASCSCSVPVHICSKCGDCDYGDNDEARRIMEDCALERGEPA